MIVYSIIIGRSTVQKKKRMNDKKEEDININEVEKTKEETKRRESSLKNSDNFK